MVTILIGGLLNIVLDPIFIFYFDMGVSGAALATVLSQMVSCAWVLSFLLGKRSVLRIRAKYLIPKAKTLKGILSLGLSPFFMHSTEGILLMCFNRQLLKFGGDIAVSAMTVLTAMAQILFLVMEGIAQGSQPIISFNYGADKLERVRATIKLSALASLIYGAVLSIAMELAPEIFVRIFAEDRELITLAARLLRVYIAGYIIIGANCTIQQAYTSLGCGKRAFFFAFYRKIILLIPLIYILPHFISNGVFAVILAEPVSDILTTCTNVVFFSRFFKKSLTENT
jgi:Na+-driven multidrug efflux pump